MEAGLTGGRMLEALYSVCLRSMYLHPAALFID